MKKPLMGAFASMALLCFSTGAAGKAALQTEEGMAIETVFAGIIDCSANELYRIRATK